MPQGSILGPTLFLIYVNDLEDHLLEGVELATYADDTTLYTALRTKSGVRDACATLQAGVDAMEKWGKDWRISFEPTKCMSMTFSRKCEDWDIPHITLDGAEVPEEDLVKCPSCPSSPAVALVVHTLAIHARNSEKPAITIYFCNLVFTTADSAQ